MHIAAWRAHTPLLKLLLRYASNGPRVDADGRRQPHTRESLVQLPNASGETAVSGIVRQLSRGHASEEEREHSSAIYMFGADGAQAFAAALPDCR